MISGAQFANFADIDDMHGLNARHGYETVNAMIRTALALRHDDLRSETWGSQCHRTRQLGRRSHRSSRHGDEQHRACLSASQGWTLETWRDSDAKRGWNLADSGCRDLRRELPELVEQARSGREGLSIRLFPAMGDLPEVQEGVVRFVNDKLAH